MVPVGAERDGVGRRGDQFRGNEARYAPGARVLAGIGLYGSSVRVELGRGDRDGTLDPQHGGDVDRRWPLRHVELAADHVVRDVGVAPLDECHSAQPLS